MATNNKHITVDQLNTVAQGIATKSDARFRKAADKIAEGDLGTELAGKLNGKANTSDLGTLASKSNVGTGDFDSDLTTAFNGKANAADVYAKSETYTKNEVDTKISAAASSSYHAGGTLAASGIVAGLLVEANDSKVYNISDEFTTTADFVEGAGKKHPAGTNIVVVNTGTTDAPAYKFDVLAGFVDLSNYATKDETAVATEQDIQGIVDGIYAENGD